jgi:multiple sugar transport system substrate-binding protein
MCRPNPELVGRRQQRQLPLQVHRDDAESLGLIPAHHFFNNPDNYFNKSATIEWPDGPDGRKPTYMVAVKTIIIPKDSTNKDIPLAKEFIKFVLEPKRFTDYIKGANGRWFPAFKDVASDPSSPRAGGQGRGGGPASPTVTRIYLERPPGVRALQESRELADLRGERVGQGDGAHQRGQVEPTRRADEAIGRIKTIVAQWR